MRQRLLAGLAWIRSSPRFAIIFAYLLIILIAGLFWPRPGPLWRGLWAIITEPGVLITDYMALAGPGPALVNAGLVGLIGLTLVAASGAAISGPTIAAIFTMTGFALFGKSLFNILPLIAGVALTAWYKRERFRHFVLVAMFGTALGPLVSHIVFSLGMGIIPGILIGVAAGALLPDLASHFLHVHAGFNLYNIGFTTGFVGTLASTQLRSYGRATDFTLIWSHEHTGSLAIMTGVYFVSMVALGILLEKGTLRRLKDILRQPGILVSDFVQNTGLGPALVNMGLVGLTGLAYVWLVGADINGPVAGALLVMAGFGAFGKHPLNIVPVMAGVYLGTRVKIFNASDPGPILAALFCTTLAPVSGAFGPLFGLVAGYLHLGLVMHIGWLHGGVNLYNNGFSGGIIAAVMITVARTLGIRGNRMADWLGGLKRNA